MQLQKSISIIQQLALEKEEENENFVSFLNTFNEKEIDEEVYALNEIIEPLIDCTSCGNCCKSLMINVTEKEADVVAEKLQLIRIDFDNRFLEKGNNGLMIINQIPCHFLTDNKCTVYENRFAGCREFPALHLPHFKQRLFTVMMHYNRCPIIYNVVEELKLKTGF